MVDHFVNGDFAVKLKHVPGEQNRKGKYGPRYDYRTDESLRLALEMVLRGETINKAVEASRICHTTIKKYYAMYLADAEASKTSKAQEVTKFLSVKHKVHDIFTSSEELDLIEYFNQFEDLFFGLSEKECRILAYQMAAKNKLDIPKDWKNGMANLEWPQFFKGKYAELEIEKPIRCFNRTLQNLAYDKRNISDFYDNLEKYVQSNPEFKDSSRIYSLDEMCIDIKLPQNECTGDVITICSIICASGACLPPVIVESNQSVEDTNHKIQQGAMTLISPGGRMHADLLPEIVKHFLEHSSSSPNNPSILIMDTDICHLSLSAFDLAIRSGVHILTIHTHTSKLLQPLKRGPFDLISKYYKADIESWMTKKKSCSLENDEAINFIRQNIAKAYDKAMTPENVKIAFSKCGIVPFDRDLFTEEDFSSCAILDTPCAECRARGEKLIRPQLPDSENLSEQSSTPLEGTSRDTTDISKENCEEQICLKTAENNIPKPRIFPQNVAASEMSEKNKATGSELDKLKRRMIRSVSRLLKEKKSEDEVWQELKIENGTNCKKLWERMRSLTIKKLKRLLDVDDRIELVPGVARMTITDWLLCDLVIVHEKVDVIDRNNPFKESQVLVNLFELIQKFSIEGRTGDDLVEAWTAATLYYNSKGHQCSPMLMQRRWYQIKELTRDKMYKFWFKYRGNQRLLSNAKQHAPTELQKAIAHRYPEIITKPFPDWQELIDLKLIIMPEELEVKMRKQNLMKSIDDNAPDVMIVEQKIDTITLGDSDSDFSDDENSRESDEIPLKPDDLADNEEMQTPIIVQVKSEPQDNVTDTFYQPPSEQANNRLLDEINRISMVEDKIASEVNVAVASIELDDTEVEEGMMPLITNVKGAVDTVEDTFQNNASLDDNELGIDENTDTQESILIDDDDDIPSKDVNSEKNIQVTQEIEDINQTEATNVTQDQNESDDVNPTEIENPIEVVNTIEVVTPTEILNQNEVVSQTEVASEVPIEEEKQTTFINQPEGCDQNDTIIDITSPEPKRITKREPIIDMLEIEEPTIMIESVSSIAIDSAVTMQIDTDYSTEYTTGNENCNPPVTSTEDNQILEKDVVIEDDKTHELDHDVSEMNFADDGIEFADEGIEYVEDDDDCNGTPLTEPVRNTAHSAEESPKFDLKLLMNTVVYTTKLDDMSVYKNRSLYDTIDNRELVEKIIVESKPVSTNYIKVEPDKTDNLIGNVGNQDKNHTDDTDDDLFHNESDEDSDCIPESKKVKLSSHLLQKPKSRSYNPIQLCKNPDFNTRLKRLNVAFFKSSRNRAQLNACKPMTIDLSKSFESKLVDGTIYLKPSDETVQVDVEDMSESTSVLPSAVAVQSLMDNTDINNILQEELKKRMLERNKPITLPHINVVRQINQNLLMAEVAPIMAEIDNSVSSNDANLQNDTIVDEQNKAMIDIKNKAVVIEHNLTSTYSQEKPTSIDLSTNQATNDTKIDNPTVSNNPMLHNLLKEQYSERYSSNEASLSNSLEKLKPGETLQPTKLEKLLEKRKKILEKKQNIPSWIIKGTNVETAKSTDSLLTIDTLYKMLNALDPCEYYASKLNKPKNKIMKKKNAKNKMVKVTTRCQKSADDIVIDADKTETTKSTVVRTKANKPNVTYKNKNCCWAKSKILKITGITPNVRLGGHRCSQNCRCCCKEELRQAALDIEVKILQGQNAPADNVKSVIEDVVQQSSAYNQCLADQVVSTSSKTEDVGLQTDINTSHAYEIVNQLAANKLATTPKTALQLEESEVTIDLDCMDESPTSSPPSNEALLPIPKIRVYTGDTVKQTKLSIASRPLSQRTRNKNISRTIVQPPMTLVYPKTVDKMLATEVTSNETLSSNLLSSKTPEELPCSCEKNVVEKSSPLLCVNGSVLSECLRHSKSRVSKETRIYINRKHMSETERPFYVGKNKILLTNIKQPAPQLPPPPPPTPAELTLPEGVQVVLLPDGTISYLLDPNVELTPTQVATMPVILNAILDQIKAAGITLPTESNTNSEVNVINDAEKNKNSRSTVESNQTITQDQENSESKNNTEPVNTTVQSNLENTESNVGENELNSKVPNIGTDIIDAETCATPASKKTAAMDTAETSTSLTSPLPSEIADRKENSLSGKEALVSKEHAIDASPQPTTSAITNDENDSLPDNEAFASKEISAIDTAEINVSPTCQLLATADSEHNSLADKESLANNEPTTKGSSEISKSPTSPLLATGEITKSKQNSEPDKELLSNKETITKDTSEIVKSPTSSLPAAGEITDSKNKYAETPEKNKVDPMSVDDTNNGANTSRNLLSDLMEMSGIMEEDVGSLDATAGTNPPETQPQMLELPIAPQDSSIDLTVPTLLPIGSKHTISAKIDEKVHELNPITSFAELKYACDNGGLFFKLDLNTGFIVPINVCICTQKSKSDSTANTKASISPSEVIDLTDEQGLSLDENSFSVSHCTKDGETKSDSQTSRVISAGKKITPRNLSTMLAAQPKLVKKMPKQAKLVRTLPNQSVAVTVTSGESNPVRRRGRPPKINILKARIPPSITPESIEVKKQRLLSRLSNNLKPLKLLRQQNITILRKKPLLSNDNVILPYRSKGVLDSTINLVDSDVSMDEQYLVDKSSDESDDEPLAKIAKKMRSGIDNGSPITENPNEEVSQSDPASQPEMVTYDVNIVNRNEANIDDANTNETSMDEDYINNTNTAKASMEEDNMDANYINKQKVNENNSDDIDFEQEIDSLTTRKSIVEKEPVPTQLVLSGPAMMQPLLLNDAFLTGNVHEDLQDDCILGV